AASRETGPGEEPGAEERTPVGPTEVAEEEAAEVRQTVVFQDVLQAALQRGAGMPVRRALEEAAGGAALRAELADRLWDAVLEARPGAQEALALEPRWLGLLGAAGYEALLRRCPPEEGALRRALEARR